MSSFWDTLHEWQQDSRIRRLERGGTRTGGSPAADTITSLREQVAKQAGDIVMLRAVIGALASTLRDSLAAPGTVDASVLDARLEAAIEEALLPPELPTVPADPNLRIVTCVRCQQEVPASTTTMTAQGFTCDRCPPRP